VVIIKKYSIKKIKAREVLDSRGNPTIEVDVVTAAGLSRAIVPSGASTGKHEALELRDKGKRYHGKGVLKAVKNVNNVIAPKLIGDDCVNQEAVDEIMLEIDSTPNKSKLGANAMLAVSMAVCKAAAHYLQVPLFEYIGSLANSKANIMPVPQFNIINGGKHAGAENDIQEHMIMPTGAKKFSEALQMGVETYHELKSLLKKKFGASAILLGDEGGFAPKISKIEQRLELIEKAIKNAGYSKEIKFALDCASSEFFYKKYYKIGKKKYLSGQLIDFYFDLIKKYDIISIEDGMAEDDWQGWKEMTKKLGNKIQIVGDDLLVTNPVRINKAAYSKACNSLLLKLNQIGTVTEAINAAKIAKKHDWNVIVSHRSGETEDAFIADFVVGLNAGQSKFGAPARSERNAKYNQLLRIEEMLGSKSKYFKF
jgi:enolase